MFCFVDESGLVTGATLEEIDPGQVELADDSDEWLTFIRQPTAYCHVDDERNVVGITRKRSTSVQMQILLADDRVDGYKNRSRNQPDPQAALQRLVLHLAEAGPPLPGGMASDLSLLRDLVDRRSDRGRPA